MEFVFKTKTPGERQRILQALQKFVRAHKIPATAQQAADLTLEEALTNILSYAYSDAREHVIQVRLEIVRDELAIEISDDGKPFNPLDHPAPDLTIPAAGRPIGGLGIHMIRQSMDKMEYERAGDRNILRLRKSIRE